LFFDASYSSTNSGAGGLKLSIENYQFFSAPSFVESNSRLRYFNIISTLLSLPLQISFHLNFCSIPSFCFIFLSEEIIFDPQARMKEAETHEEIIERKEPANKQ
jgi:hypothetical protein